MFDQERACQEIASGKSLREVGRIVDTSPANICRIAAIDPVFAEQYSRAMEIRADWHADRIEELATMVEDGSLAPDRARVAIDARKWTASKLRPKRYGDKLQVDADLRLQVELVDATAQPLLAQATLAPALPALAVGAHNRQEDPSQE